MHYIDILRTRVSLQQPMTPRVYLSKQVQKCPKQPRNEGDILNFDEFCEIGCISLNFGLKNMFSDSFES